MNNKAHTRNSLKPIALGLMLLTVNATALSPVYAAEKPVNNDVSFAQYVGWGDPDMAKIAVTSGRTLVQYLRSASALLDEGRIKQARSVLYTSHEFTAAIERMMPYLVVVKQMDEASKNVITAEANVFSADLLPIYASLDDLQIYAPKVASKARHAVQQANKHAAGGDRKKAATVLKEAADIVARGTVYLPVDYVDFQVNAALYAVNLPKPDTKTAKLAVTRAMDSLTTVVNAVAEPTAG